MRVNLEIVPRPQSSSFIMFADIDLELLKDTKEITVESNLHTKTRVSTSMQVGQARVGINLPIEGFKTYEEQSNNYYSGGMNISNYFVRSKKQDVNLYIEYVKTLIAYII
jgi:hypothetical protein